MRLTLLTSALLCLALAACSELPVSLTLPPPQPSPTATQPATPTEILITPTPGPATLRLWVPPQFDPDGNRRANRLLRARLDEFAVQHPDVLLEVRLKAEDGPGGLLDALGTSHAAAPLVLPDLILMPRAQLETAALKGLLFPFDGLTTALEDEDWFDYARSLARLQDSIYGLPFAGDGQVLVFRPSEISVPPRDWAEALQLPMPLIFPANDERALFTLQQYSAGGAPVQDSEGRPVLQAGALASVLAFYQQARAAGIMPFWLTQYSSSEQVWEAYKDKTSSLAAVPISNYLQNLPGDTMAAPVPMQDGKPFMLVDGWVWTLPTAQADRHPEAVELAEFLTDADFLASWTEAAGYLPPRPSALAGWSNGSSRTLLQRLIGSAQILPPVDVLALVSPALQQATVEVLKEESDPETAAKHAIEMLQAPEPAP